MGDFSTQNYHLAAVSELRGAVLTAPKHPPGMWEIQIQFPDLKYGSRPDTAEIWKQISHLPEGAI